MNHKITGTLSIFGALGLALVLLASPASAAWGGNLVPGGGLYFDKLQFDAEPGDSVVQNIYIYANVTTDTWVETGGSGMVLIYAFEDETSYPVAWEYTLKATNDTQMKLTLSVPSNAKPIDYGVFVWDAGMEGCEGGGYDGFLEVAAAGGIAKYFTVSVQPVTKDLMTPLLWMLGGMVLVGIAGVWLAATRKKYRDTWWDEAAAAILMIAAIGAIVWGAWGMLTGLGYL